MRRGCYNACPTLLEVQISLKLSPYMFTKLGGIMGDGGIMVERIITNSNLLSNRICCDIIFLKYLPGSVEEKVNSSCHIPQGLLTKEQIAFTMWAAVLLPVSLIKFHSLTSLTKNLFSLERKCNCNVNRATQVELSFSPITDIRSALTTVGSGAQRAFILENIQKHLPRDLRKVTANACTNSGRTRSQFESRVGKEYIFIYSY